MKSEKGKQVFIDNVDILLSDKIIGHTKKIGAGKYAGAMERAPHTPEGLTGKDQDMKKQKAVLCKRSHISDRYISCHICVDCLKKM